MANFDWSHKKNKFPACHKIKRKERAAAAAGGVCGIISGVGYLKVRNPSVFWFGFFSSPKRKAIWGSITSLFSIFVLLLFVVRQIRACDEAQLVFSLFSFDYRRCGPARPC